MPYSLKCPACRKKFPWNPVEGFPENCPLCETRVAHDRADDDIVVPFIRSNGHTKATDEIYRQMEAGSEVRAQAAAEIAGVPASEMSDLKITDLRPTTRPGDVAAVPVNNAVTQQMDRMRAQGRPVGFGGMDGSGLSGEISTGAVSINGHVVQGVEPNAGARARTKLQDYHSRLTHGAGVSDRPALETLQPGYRIRG